MESYAVLVLKTSSLGSWQDGVCELRDILSAWGGLFAKGTRCAYANQQISSKCFYKPLTSEHTCSESHTHTRLLLHQISAFFPSHYGSAGYMGRTAELPLSTDEKTCQRIGFTFHPH